MKNKFLISLILYFLLTGAAAAAQTPSDGTFVRVIQVHVKPGMAAQYEAARRDLIAHMTQHKFPYPFSESRGENLVYRRIIPIGTWGELDKHYEELDKIRSSRDPSIRRRLDEAIDHLTYWTFRTRPELGYTPENPRLSPDQVGLHHYSFLYLRRGALAEAETILRKLGDLWKKHNPRSNFLVVQAVTGPDLPMLLIRRAARDAADYYTEGERFQRAAGDERRDLVAQLRKTYRRLETSNNTVLPDLSYRAQSPPN